MATGEHYRVYEVFTPTSPAKLNFVARSELEDRLTECLMTPGKQVIVYGETGSGKSSLLGKKLRELYETEVITRCTNGTTFEGMVLDAFDKLDAWYHDSSSKETLAGKKARIEANLGFLRGSIEGQGRGGSASSRRVVQPQLTAQRLGETMGEMGSCWVIEDFHKVEQKHKVLLAQTLKVFSDLSSEYPNLKIIAVGATDTAREVVEYDREMKNRVAEIHVPLMKSAEVLSILNQGGELLNVGFNAISSDIVRFSAGLPSVCHNFALNACLARGIDATQPGKILLDDQDCEKAVQRYIEESSDTLKAVFEKALFRHRTRSYDNCKLILTALAQSESDSASHAEIFRQIKQNHAKYPASNLTRYLAELCTESRGFIIRRDGNGKYRFTEPLYRSYAQAVLAPQSTFTSALQYFSTPFQVSLSESLFTLTKDWTPYIVTTTETIKAETIKVDIIPSLHITSEGDNSVD